MATAWRTAFATFSFVFMNCLLNIFNSWALRRSSWPDFEFPVFYTMSHMIVTALAALLLLAYVTPAATGMPTLSQFWHYKEALVPVAICTTLNLGLNNLSLTLVSLFVNQAIKACTPLPVMVFSNRLAGKAYSRAIILCVALLVVGSIMANTHKMLLTSSKRTSLPGVVICITSMLANALRTVLVVMLMNRDTKERPKLAPTVVMFYDSTCAACFMLVYWLLSNERVESIEYFTNPTTTLVGMFVVSVGASMAFLFNIAGYYFTLYTSALTSTVGANGVKVVLITGGAIWGGITDALSWMGISLTIIAICAYSYINVQEQQVASQASEVTVKEAQATPPAANESTPLNQARDPAADGTSKV